MVHETVDWLDHHNGHGFTARAGGLLGCSETATTGYTLRRGGRPGRIEIVKDPTGEHAAAVRVAG